MLGYQTVKMFEDKFTPFNTMHKRDRQTGRQTDTARRISHAMHSVSRQYKPELVHQFVAFK